METTRISPTRPRPCSQNSPSVVAILGDAGDGTRLLDAVAQATADADPPTIVVNDALRDAQTQQVIQGLPRAFREQIRGVAPLAVTPNDLDLNELYAANAYDCVNLIALAAIQAGSEIPTSIAAQMASVSAGGSQCRTFADCADRLGRGLQIDYEGPSGNTELSTRTGDPARARFEEFEFDQDGRDESVMTFEIAERMTRGGSNAARLRSARRSSPGSRRRRRRTRRTAPTPRRTASCTRRP